MNANKLAAIAISGTPAKHENYRPRTIHDRIGSQKIDFSFEHRASSTRRSSFAQFAR